MPVDPDWAAWPNPLVVRRLPHLAAATRVGLALRSPSSPEMAHTRGFRSGDSLGTSPRPGLASRYDLTGWIEMEIVAALEHTENGNGMTSDAVWLGA